MASQLWDKRHVRSEPFNDDIIGTGHSLFGKYKQRFKRWRLHIAFGHSI
jgi:hypothetical protein